MSKPTAHTWDLGPASTSATSDATRIVRLVGLNTSLTPIVSEFIVKCEIEYRFSKFGEPKSTETPKAPPGKLIRKLVGQLKKAQQTVQSLSQPEFDDRWKATAHQLNNAQNSDIEDPDDIRISLGRLETQIDQSLAYLKQAEALDGRSIVPRQNNTDHEREIVRACIDFWAEHTGQPVRTRDADFEDPREFGGDLAKVLPAGPRFVFEVVACIGGDITPQSATKKIQEANRIERMHRSDG